MLEWACRTWPLTLVMLVVGACTMTDPVRHEAVTSVNAPGVAPGTVVGVVRPGYLIGDEVLRPAQVAVAG